MRVTLGFGRTPLDVEVPDSAIVVAPPPPAPARDVRGLLAEALARPIGGALAAPRGAKVTVIVSDATRREPRREMLEAVRLRLEGARVTVAIANGTHTPGPIPDDLVDLSDATMGGAPPGSAWRGGVERSETPPIVNHDPSTTELVDLGTTRRGTRVRLPRWLLGSDLVIATGRIRPHYFAGFGAGAKAIFPGLGHPEDIRVNHRLKSDPTSRLGRVDGNACRDDLEEAVGLLSVPTFLLDVVADAHDVVIGAVAGDLIAAHRAGCELARSRCEVATPRADVVVVSDSLPLAGSLYQASKLLAPAGMMLKDGGVAVLAAECPLGTGPLDIVNQGIYEIGIRHFFPREHTIYLVSGLQRATVDATYCRFAASIEEVLARHAGTCLVVPHAGSIIPRPV